MYTNKKILGVKSNSGDVTCITRHMGGSVSLACINMKAAIEINKLARYDL